MALKIIGDGYVFGADSTNTNAQSVSINTASQEASAMNYQGDYVAVALYGQTQELSVEVLATDGDVPKLGDTFTAGSTAFVVTGVNETSSNTDFARYSITGKTWGDLNGTTSA